jgi:hypothetical protein
VTAFFVEPWSAFQVRGNVARSMHGTSIGNRLPGKRKMHSARRIFILEGLEATPGIEPG